MSYKIFIQKAALEAPDVLHLPRLREKGCLIFTKIFDCEYIKLQNKSYASGGCEA